MASSAISPPPASGPVRRACDCCHKRKVRCIPGENQRPCKNCALTGLFCTYNAVPQKKGPKGNRAKIISELRETQSASNKSSSSPSSGPLSPVHFGPTPGLLSMEFIESCLEFFFAEMYPTQLVLHRAQMVDIVSRMDSDSEAYCLVVALCAYVMIQPNMLPTTPTEEAQFADRPTAYVVLREALRVRKAIDYNEEPTVLSVCTSFFLFGSYFCVGKDAAAWCHLREATTLAYAIDMHQEESYMNLAIKEAETRRRLYWLLFVTERAYALQRHKPVSLPSTIRLPSPVDGLSDDVELSGFIHLIRLFQPFDELFLGIWNKSRQGCSISWIIELQRQLTQCLPQYLQSTETQAVDLRISQQWLKQMVWQLSIAQGCLSSHAPDKSLTFDYPVELAKEMIGTTTTFSHAAMELHGIGLVEKLFDVACTLVDVLSCVPTKEQSSIQYGPRDYLRQFLNVMSSLRGGRQKYVPLLMAKVEETLPSAAREFTVPTPRTLSSSDSMTQVGVLSLTDRPQDHDGSSSGQANAIASPSAMGSPEDQMPLAGSGSVMYYQPLHSPQQQYSGSYSPVSASAVSDGYAAQAVIPGLPPHDAYLHYRQPSG